MAQNKIIVSCALTGAIHTPSMSPYLPVNSEQIVNHGIQAVKSGAAILHVHAREEHSGKPDQSIEGFEKILPRLKNTGAIINITTGGSPYMKVEERAAPSIYFAPELSSLNMGSINFGLFPMLNRFSEFKNPWEHDHLQKSKSLIFRNTFEDIEYILKNCSKNKTKFEYECYDIGHIYTVKHFVDRGLIKDKPFVQAVLGILGGIGSHPDDMHAMKKTADRLLGQDYHWSALGAGASQLRTAAISASMGGHIRVGLEDSLWISPRVLAKSSADQVSAAKGILSRLGLELATPDDARSTLGLKGSSDVNF